MKIFISGASSGIGEYLAYAYARQGAILGLAARRIELLEQIAAKCHEHSGKTYVYGLDVKDQNACKNTAEMFIRHAGGADIIIANAGIGGLDHLSSGDASIMNDIFTTNVLGVSNTIVPFIPLMKDQNSGKVVIISSVAGFRGLINHGAYSGSKAAIRIMGDSWRFSLSPFNIQVTIICPGFIKTPLVEKNRFPMPFLMEPDITAEKIINAINNGKKTYIFPWQWRLILPILKNLPHGIIQWMSAKTVV